MRHEVVCHSQDHGRDTPLVMAVSARLFLPPYSPPTVTEHSLGLLGLEVNGGGE